MPITNINTSNHADFVPEIWLNEALGYLRKKIHLIPRVSRNSDLGGAFDVGDVVNIPKRGGLVANQRTETGEIILQQPNSDKVQVSLDQHWDVSFSLSDFMENMAVSDVEGGYVADALGVLAEKVESTIFGLYPSFVYSAGAFGALADEDGILECRQILNENECPQDMRTMIVSSKDETALLKVDRLTRADAYGKNGVIAEGAIGRAGGFDIFQSNLVPVVAGTPNETHNIAFHKQGLVLVSRPLKPIKGAISTQIQDPVSGLIMRLTMGYNPNYNKDQVVLDMLWGVGILREEFVVDFRA